MGKKVKKARKGKMKVICRAAGTPQWSATQPRTVVETPPIPRARPRMRPEAIPRLLGIRLWPMAMVTALEAMITTPAKPKKMRERVP